MNLDITDMQIGAEQMFCLYKAFVKAGFSESQSLYLVGETIKGAASRGK